MKNKPTMTTAESQVNFEAMWQAWPQNNADQQVQATPSLLGSERERRFFRDRRYLPNVVARIKASRQLRLWRRTTPRSVVTRSHPYQRRQQIIADLGLIFSTCTLVQARGIVSSCNNVQKQQLLAAFFSLPYWGSSRLGRELAPSMRRVGL